MKLKTRLVYLNLAIVLISATVIMTAFMYSMYTNNRKQSIEIVKGQTKTIAAEMEMVLSNARTDAKNLAEAIKVMKMNNLTRNQVNTLLKEKLEATDHYVYTWVVFEPNAFDGKDNMYVNKLGSNEDGQYVPCWGKTGSSLELSPCQAFNTNPYYQVPMETGKSFVAEPARYELGGEMVTTVSFCEPIILNGRKIGVAGLDISLAGFTAMNDSITFYETGSGRLLTKDGVIVADKNTDLLGDVAPEFSSDQELLEQLRQGESKQIVGTYQGKKAVRVYEPIHFVGMDNIWAYEAIVPYSEMMASTNRITIMLCGVAFVGVLVMAVSLIINSNYAVDSFVSLSSIIKRLATYDLTFDSNHRAVTFLKRKDETGEMTNQLATMQNNFIDLVKQVREAVEQVAASSEELTAITGQTAMGSEEVAKTIGELASGASEQARSTEDGSDKIYRLGELIDTNKELMDQVSTETKRVVNLIGEGLSIVGNLTKITDESNEASKEIHGMIKETNNSSSKIGQASNVIAAIAEQTNLLALNAAIEAARAGEAGKGFAVVAEEIRNLAEQSTSSTKQIDAVVEELSNNAKAAVKRMEEISIIVEAQAKSVRETEEKFNEISTAMTSSKEGVSHMNGSVGEMNENKEGILDVMQSLSALAEENAASTEEAAATTQEQSASIQDIANASDNLSILAQEIQTNVDQFKV